MGYKGFLLRRGRQLLGSGLPTLGRLSLQGPGSRSFAARLKHRRNGIRKPFGAHQTDRWFAGDPCVAIGQMASDLFMGTVDHRHLTIHKTLKRRVAEPAGKGKYMINAFFLQRAGEDFTATQPCFLCHL